MMNTEKQAADGMIPATDMEALIPDDLKSTLEDVDQMIDKTAAKVKDDYKEAALTWKFLKKAKGFQVQYSRNKDFSDSKMEKIRKAKDIKKLIKKLKTGKKYYARVRIYAKADKKEYYSDWSKVKKLKT